ncbi:MAG: 1-acyl-sn-glycerol-3-phosphate acyltransferase [Clostridia bacterium]|nr:1-acyl-sn-glycerol-3-phosphate acyltransferase [Clostridia bacterium]
MEKNKKKNKKWSRPIHRVIFYLLAFVLKPIYRIRYGYTTKHVDMPKDEPCLILSNHQTFADQFLVGFSFYKHPIYMMATERIFNLGFISSVIKFVAAPIMKKKSKVDIMAVKNSAKVLKEGGKVLIFPEGNCTYDGRLCTISTGAAKMVKMLKVPVLLYNLHGGYGAKPRWARSARRGKMTGCVVKKLMPEEYESLSAEELSLKINEYLTVKEIPSSDPFKSNRRAEYLEKMLYWCPHCNSYQTLYSKGNHVTCTNCGMTAEYTVNLTFNGENCPCTTTEWYDMQAAALLKKLSNFDGTIFKDENAKLSSFGDGKTVFISKGEISLTPTTFTAGGKTFDVKDIESMAIQQNSAIIFYVNDVSYFLKGGKRFNPLKYMHAFYMLKHLSSGGNYDEPIVNVYLGL